MSDMLKQTAVIEPLLTTIFFILLLCGAYQDIRDRRIPGWVSLGILLLSFAGFAFLGWTDARERVLGTLVASFPMILATLVSPGAFGGGDIKLMAACGMFLGAREIFYSFFYALLLGGIYSVYLLLYKNKSRKEEFAFGPFLTAGLVLSFVFRLF